jgi:signal transduction histidine kinase
VINGYLQVIEMMAKDQLDDTFLQHLHRVRRASSKMTQIIDTLLLFASVRRQSHLDLTTLEMGDIIKEALERLDTVVNNSEADVIVQADTWPRVYGYADWVEEVWVNYISNAVKYGGAPPHITLGYDEHSEGMICFWVQDNGQGLSVEEQDRLFMQFSRLAPGKAEGHGLGLSIVLRIVEKLGGEVGMESQIEQGSKFWFTLPTSINAESTEAD